MTIRITLAGATGWVGRALVAAIARSSDLTLAGATSRSQQGRDAGASAQPYVAGTLLAARGVGSFTGLKRGLDHVLD